MDEYQGCTRGFHHHNRASYAKRVSLPDRVVDQVNFGYFANDGGCAAEMKMEWRILSDPTKPAARLCAFQDSFAALLRFHDVISALAAWDGKYIRPDEFCRLLVEHGFADRTYTAPFDT